MYDQVQIHFCMAHDLVAKTNTLMENGFLVLKHIPGMSRKNDQCTRKVQAASYCFLVSQCRQRMTSEIASAEIA